MDNNMVSRYCKQSLNFFTIPTEDIRGEGYSSFVVFSVGSVVFFLFRIFVNTHQQ